MLGLSWSNRPSLQLQLSTRVLGGAGWRVFRRALQKPPGWAPRVPRRDETEERKRTRRRSPVARKRATMRNCPSRDRRKASERKASISAWKDITAPGRRGCPPLTRYCQRHQVRLHRQMPVQSLSLGSGPRRERGLHHHISPKRLPLAGRLLKEERCIWFLN